jgi:hypothetical protein
MLIYKLRVITVRSNNFLHNAKALRENAKKERSIIAVML